MRNTPESQLYIAISQVGLGILIGGCGNSGTALAALDDTDGDKAAVSACRRHSFVEGIRNGGLDFVKAAVKLIWACQYGCCTTAFFLLPSSGS